MTVTEVTMKVIMILSDSDNNSVSPIWLFNGYTRSVKDRYGFLQLHTINQIFYSRSGVKIKTWDQE